MIITVNSDKDFAPIQLNITITSRGELEEFYEVVGNGPSNGHLTHLYMTLTKIWSDLDD